VPSTPRAAPAPQVLLAVQVAGTAVVEQAGRRAVLRPGDMTVCDAGLPYTVRDRERTRTHYVRVPREALALPRDRLDPLLAVRIGADTNPLAAAVGSFFAALATGPALERPDAAHALAEPSIHLVRALLAVHAGGPGRDAEDLLTRVQRYIRDHLADRDLTPARIAAAHHVSVRHLYAVHARAGTGVRAGIRRQRLEACRRELRDPRFAHQSVATVGGRWGFADPSHFGRVFKAAYGLTPNEWRAGQPFAAAGSLHLPPE
jgi:AraC-like DNA-binding protein